MRKTLLCPRAAAQIWWNDGEKFFLLWWETHSRQSDERTTVVSTHSTSSATTQAGIHLPTGNTSGSTLYYQPQKLGTAVLNSMPTSITQPPSVTHPKISKPQSQTACAGSANLFIKLMLRLLRHWNVFVKQMCEKKEAKFWALHFTWRMKTTSSIDPRDILREIRSDLEANNCLDEQRNHFHLFCSKGDGPGENPGQWDMEDCRLPRLWKWGSF